MSASGLQGRDIFMRHTGGDGKSYVSCHRVWGADIFESAQTSAAAKAAADDAAKGKPLGKHKAERITEAQFHSERKA